MKWTIVGLVFVGLIAAVSAAVLAVTLRTDIVKPGVDDAASAEITIMVAARALPANSLVDSASVATQTVKRIEAPANTFTSTAQVIGRPLRVPVLAGQPFTSQQFASSESGVQLAVTIPEGSRAMSVLLTDDSGIENLLYPGSIVDVVASFRFPSIDGSSSAEVVSVTLLQGLQVLDVGGRSIVDDEKAQGEVEANGRRNRMVTLMVNPAQAEALQLASTNGKISLSLRNPLDMQMANVTGTRISDLNKDLAERIRKLAAQETGMVALAPPMLPSQPSGSGAVSSTPEPPKELPLWSTTILRGSIKEVQKFPMPVEDSAH